MAIQMRRGNAVDFDPSKMVPGEWAVSQDNKKLYICFSPGNVVEIGSVDAVLPYVYEAEAWAKGTKNGEDVQSTDPEYHNNSKYFSEQAGTSATNAATSETNAGNSATTATNKAGEASTSATNANTNALKSEGYAIGKQNGTDVGSSSPYYQNNSKYYAEWADDSANSANTSKNYAKGYAQTAGNASTSANTNALKAEGYAVGKQNGEDVGSGSTYYHNNSKYYSEQASNSATSAENSATLAEEYRDQAAEIVGIAIIGKKVVVSTNQITISGKKVIVS